MKDTSRTKLSIFFKCHTLPYEQNLICLLNTEQIKLPEEQTYYSENKIS